jgi:hypothetical protein
LDIWISLFEREFTLKDMEARVVQQMIIQYREKFLDHFVLLFCNHYEQPVLVYLASKVDHIDPFLQIQFLGKILPNLEMPIEARMYVLMLEMLRNAPGQSISTAPQVKRLMASGHHMDLDQTALDLLHNLEAQI